MKTEDLGNLKIMNLLFKPAGFLMESKFRQKLFDPMKILRGANIQTGQTILEVGCGTGFFTIPLAHLIEDQGYLVAMDVLSDYIDRVTEKVQASNLNNVRIIKRDALNTGLDGESIDKILLFGVIPFPSLPLNQLLPEMYRILKPDGTLAVWLFPISFGVPKSIIRSGLFRYIKKQNGVYNYIRI
jgi:demethylmenaquinone methyltransferase/2-methoxy-6-polyprenyl-1,4-benzoquinol methylase